MVRVQTLRMILKLYISKLVTNSDNPTYSVLQKKIVKNCQKYDNLRISAERFKEIEFTLS